MTRETEDRNRDRQRKGLEPIIPNEGIRVQLGRRMSVLYGPTSMTSDGFKTKRKAHEDDGRVPEDSLELRWAYGYNGLNGRANTYYNAHGDAAYALAGLGVVYNREKHEQKLFTQHNEDVMCMAVHPGRQFMCTGQLNPKGAEMAFCIVWDALSNKQKVKLGSFHKAGISAVAFSPDGTQVITVDETDDHWFAVWDWHAAPPQGREMEPIRSHPSGKELVMGVLMHESGKVVTYGERNAKFWEYEQGSKGDPGTYKSRVTKASREP